MLAGNWITFETAVMSLIFGIVLALCWRRPKTNPGVFLALPEFYGTMDSYLNIVENPKDGKWSAEANGTFKSDHTYWKGFPNRTAAGLRLEQRKP